MTRSISPFRVGVHCGGSDQLLLTLQLIPGSIPGSIPGWGSSRAEFLLGFSRPFFFFKKTLNNSKEFFERNFIKT